MFAVNNYADFKLIAGQFTSGKVFFCTAGGFKAWGMASGFPVLVLSIAAQPPTWATDFPTAIAISSLISTPIG